MLEKYKRNERLVDLSFIPEEIQDKILQEFSQEPVGDMTKVFNYFIENKMVLMMDELTNFKERKYETYP